MKKSWVIAIVSLFMIAYLGSCRDENTEIVGECPIVVSTIPANLATGVPLNQVISVTFNKAMDPNTINAAAFELMDPGVTLNTAAGSRTAATQVAGTVTYNPTTFTMIFTPSANLNTSTTYTGRVRTTVKDVVGNALQVAHVWTFTTVLAPRVTSTNPANNAMAVPLNQAITANFSMKMNPSTINGTTFTLKLGDTNIAGRVTYTDSTATFTPTSIMLPNSIYTANITVGAKNTAGSPMLVNHSWSFNTDSSPLVVSTDPMPGAVGVLLGKVITATFNGPMDPSSINTTNFTISRSGVNIPGTITYADNVASFTPTTALLPNTEYTGTINTLVRNALGTRLAANYVWTFTTDALPLVVSTDPANNATAVVYNKTLTAIFNVPMNPTTINATTFTLMQGTTVIAGAVTYSGTTASFNPTADLLPGLVYTATITTGAKNLLGTGLGANHVWSFTTIPPTPPTVILTDPLDNATNVLFNKVITATFSVPMDTLSITGTSFTVRQGTTVVPGTITYQGNMARFTPNSVLLPNTVYTVTITTAVKNAAGTAMAANKVWTFRTDIVPTVVSTMPVNAATNIAINTMVNATFSVAMDPATINSTTFTVRNGTVVVPGTFSFAENEVFFNPTSLLETGTTYTATITTGAKNMAGTSLASNYVWTFTTGTFIAPRVVSTDPANSATGVVLSKELTATFTVAMDPATFTSSSFTLRRGTVTVDGTITVNGTTATFKPNAPLLNGTLYTATITTAVKNTTGTNMATNYVWTFTTVAATPPTVVFTEPANGSTNIVLNQVVEAHFSVPMQSSTINGTTFTLRRDGVAVAGTVTYSGTTAYFTPNVPLTANTLYTATITTGARNQVLGTALEANYVWTFTTGELVAPTVVTTDPTNTASGVALNKTLSATFSVPMMLSSINTTTFTLKNGNTTVTGVVNLSGNTATFDPGSDLLPNTLYTATITTGARNSAGTSMANNYTWTFTTVASPPPTVTSVSPTNSATGVALNANATATFSTTMMESSITQAGVFTLRRGAVDVAGAVSYTGTTATFNPTSDLLANTLYTATITTVAKNLAGIAMANNFTWTFTTSGGVAPTVILTDPLNNATGVALGKTVTATFSENMLAASVTANGVFTLRHGTTAVNGVVTYSGTTASFDPTGNLLSGTTYTATITTAAQNQAGTAMTSNHVWTFTTSQPSGGPFVNLLTAGRFGIIAGTAVSNNAGPSQINNLDVGVSPGTSVTGFPPGIIVNGIIMTPSSPAPIPAQLTQAKLDLTAAYNFAKDATSPAPVTVSGNQGGLTLAPGIYKSTSTLSIEGTPLTLDAGGDVNAVWIFQVASGFTSTTGGSVILIGGAKSNNIFWQVGSSAIIGDNTAFHGNVLAFTSITMNSGATAVGRMLAINGAVTLTNNNTITKPQD